jgi:hypothetical protein
MPFDEEAIEEQKQNVGLAKSFTNRAKQTNNVKKPTVKDLENSVREIENKKNSYKQRGSELTIAFKKAILDKTLKRNRNILQEEIEKELLENMIRLSVDVNNDQNEPEGSGSLMWIILLLKTCLAQRDRINDLEYALTQMIDKKQSS